MSWRRLSFSVLAVLTAAIVATGATASGSEDDADGTFFDRAEEGWFWYETLPPEPEEPEPLRPAAPPPAPPPRSMKESVASAPTSAPLSSAWFRENLDSYRDRAVDDPSPDNVRLYLLLQRIAMDKASEFASATQAITIGDPLLDMAAERPISGFGGDEMDRQAFLAGQALLGHLSESVGLVFFYLSSCPFCERQAPVIEALSRTTGLEVMAVAIDHMPMRSGHFAENYVPDRGQSGLLGVTTVPAVAIMRPPNDIRMVGQGNMTLTELSRRILVVARQAGWISEDAYEATLPVRRATQTLAAELIDEAVLEDPSAFIAHLRARMTPTASPGVLR